MKKNGFTLLEVIIVVVILGIVATIGMALLKKGLTSTHASQDLIESTWQLRLAFARMEKEIREAPYNTGSNLIISPNTSISFTDPNGSSITYTRATGNFLTRNGVNLASHISALTFSYYDSNNNNTTTNSAVNCIKIDATSTRNSIATKLTTVICPRNFL